MTLCEATMHRLLGSGKTLNFSIHLKSLIYAGTWRLNELAIHSLQLPLLLTAQNLSSHAHQPWRGDRSSLTWHLWPMNGDHTSLGSWISEWPKKNTTTSMVYAPWIDIVSTDLYKGQVHIFIVVYLPSYEDRCKIKWNCQTALHENEPEAFSPGAS